MVEYAKQKYTPINSLFNFRSSNVGIRCAIYDPNHFFQNNSNYTEYDLFHILMYYEFDIISKEKYHEFTGDWGKYCDFFIRVHKRKESSAKLTFDYNADDLDKEIFERQNCGKPTALKGLRLNSNSYVPNKMQKYLNRPVYHLSSVKNEESLRLKQHS